FAEITAQQRAVWLQRRRGLQVGAPAFGISLAYPAKTAAEPCIAQSAVQFERFFEDALRFTDMVLRRKHKSAQRDGLRIAWRKLQCPPQRPVCGADPAERELQFCHACPTKTEPGRLLDRCTRRCE